MSSLPQFYDRVSGELKQETVLGDRWLRFAYCSAIRGLLRWPLFGCGCFSRLMGWYLDRRRSCRKIAPTIAELGINMDEAVVPERGWSSFNEFFARPLKAGARPLPEDPRRLIAPADCRLTVYPRVSGETVLPVKGTPYTVSELLGEDAAEFNNGSVIVCRLCPADYHRYHFIDDGELVAYRRLRGKYHSVNPLALQLGFPVFTQNLRTTARLRLKHCPQCAMVPVGAFGVASIHDHSDKEHFARGEEAGFFTFGGSTVIMVFPEGAADFDEDIVKHSAAGIETLVKVNSGIGTWRMA